MIKFSSFSLLYCSNINSGFVEAKAHNTTLLDKHNWGGKNIIITIVIIITIIIIITFIHIMNLVS